MTRRRLLLANACACALFAAAAPAAAGAAWTAPQDLGPAGFSYNDTALASNDRGDAVTAFSQSRGIRIARAAPGAPFGASITVSTDGESPRVAIDARGVALIAWSYDDGSISESDGFRGTLNCCQRTKVVVWRPGHAPTRAHVARRAGLIARLGAVAAVSGRRGVLITTSRFDETDGSESGGGLEFVPIRIDGRAGRVRTVLRSAWQGTTLQFSRGRAIVGLMDGDGPTRLAVRSQRASGAFGTLRVFLRVPEKLEYYSGSPNFSDVLMSPDGRGGQLAVLERGKRPKLAVQLVRKPRLGRLRSVLVRRGPAENFELSPPVASSDGWLAVAFNRVPAVTDLTNFGYALVVAPNGRAIVSQLSAGVSENPAVSLTRGGVGVAASVGERMTATALLLRASFMPFARGLPQPASALTRDGNGAVIQNVVLTSNRRERARAVWEEAGRVLATRLE
jgi:opacity protein-like surface antigen